MPVTHVFGLWRLQVTSDEGKFCSAKSCDAAPWQLAVGQTCKKWHRAKGVAGLLGYLPLGKPWPGRAL